jgi:hypothetical protein
LSLIEFPAPCRRAAVDRGDVSRRRDATSSIAAHAPPFAERTLADHVALTGLSANAIADWLAVVTLSAADTRHPPQHAPVGGQRRQSLIRQSPDAVRLDGDDGERQLDRSDRA